MNSDVLKAKPAQLGGKSDVRCADLRQHGNAGAKYGDSALNGADPTRMAAFEKEIRERESNSEPPEAIFV
jgi:hypothetical protein